MSQFVVPTDGDAGAHEPLPPAHGVLPFLPFEPWIESPAWRFLCPPFLHFVVSPWHLGFCVSEHCFGHEVSTPDVA